MRRLFKMLAVTSSFAIAACLLQEAFTPQPGSAAVPDEETYTFVRERYNLLLSADRSNCAYYANPATLSIDGNTREISVLMLHREDLGGSACERYFEFQIWTANCATQEALHSPRLNSPADWDEAPVYDTEAIEKICTL